MPASISRCGTTTALPYPTEEFRHRFCLRGFFHEGHALAVFGCDVGHDIDVDAVVADTSGNGDDEFVLQYRHHLLYNLMNEPRLDGKHYYISTADGFSIVERYAYARTSLSEAVECLLRVSRDSEVGLHACPCPAFDKGAAHVACTDNCYPVIIHNSQFIIHN